MTDLKQWLEAQALSLPRATIAMGRHAEGLDPLRSLCAGLPQELDVKELAEARELLSSGR